MGYKEDFIEFMVKSNVLCFGEFITKSNRKSPYFINTGNYCMGSQADKLGKYYAMCIKENLGEDFDAIYGPAYKGIPLAVATASALSRELSIDKPYFFNRKEAKDHGEGGVFIGYKPEDGDRIVLIDDVVTAGTSLKESIELLKQAADVKIEALIISVDRMERRNGDKTAIEEIKEELGIKIFPIITFDDIITALYNKPVGGKVYIDENVKAKMDEYRKLYGPKQ